jgi:prolyl oligopeptidase
MNKKFIIPILFASLVFVSCKKEITKRTIDVKYPETPKKAVIDTLFGTAVVDHYRWLEDDRSEETENWVKAENEVTFDYLSKIPYRDQLKERLSELWNYEKVGIPFIEGEYTYFYKNNGLQNQFVVYRKKGDAEPEVFLDPNTFSDDATTSLGALSFSKDGKTTAYAISEGGSDWRKIIIMDAESKLIKEDTLVDVKFSGISWYKNEGFYYSSYDKPKGSELSAKTDQHKLYYHKLGTSQKEDKVIFGEKPSEKYRYVGGNVSEDNKFLAISASVSTSGNKLFFKDLSKPDSPLITVLDHTDSDTYPIENIGNTVYLVTNLKAPNKKSGNRQYFKSNTRKLDGFYT